jgi:hypothetical protein
LEFPLTEAVAKELRAAGYRIGPPGGGDAVLLGRIAAAKETVLSESPTGATDQGRITLTVEYRLLRRGGKGVLVKGRVAESGEVVFARGEDRPQGIERAILELARAIVRGLEPPPKDLRQEESSPPSRRGG